MITKKLFTRVSITTLPSLFFLVELQQPGFVPVDLQSITNDLKRIS